jgi:pimeloyl-ACP methyl ester carboxylesterase
MISDTEISVRIHGPADAPTLVYLPGMHGDWTLVASFRERILPKVRFVELSYPRTTSWNLADYADAIDAALAVNGMTNAWLLAESWGSQPAWLLADRSRLREEAELTVSGEESASSRRRLQGGFQVTGLILAGGFVRHPWPWAVGMTQRRGATMAMSRLKRFLKLYPHYARFRLRHAPETLAEMPEFLARRTDADRLAAVHRLRLIRENDLRPQARTATLPVHYLTGAIDPVVPWPWVKRWLVKHCPGYRGSRILWAADHNVLNSRGAAEQVLEWMRGASAPLGCRDREGLRF